MRVRATAIQGLLRIEPSAANDQRGSFIKTFRMQEFQELGLATAFKEEYYSTSRHRVLRGMHLQIPPYEHAKIVCCMVGKVIDATVDLRIGSPTFGQSAMFELNGSRGDMLYIPVGVAHGFYVPGESATLMYKVTAVYSREHDCGIRWDSAGIPWPDTSPIVSERDCSLPALADFCSPFCYMDGARDG